MTSELLQRALVAAAARSNPSVGTSAQKLHAARSQAWVRCLGEELKRFEQQNRGDAVTMFCKSDGANREEFGLNELLYDVCVCLTEECPSASGARNLRYVSKALWQVESEFDKHNSREWVKDFNKLVIGAAENKLFVGPRLGEVEQMRYLETVLPVARCCSGNVFLAAVAHPESWGDGAGGDVGLWKLNDHWEAVQSES